MEIYLDWITSIVASIEQQTNNLTKLHQPDQYRAVQQLLTKYQTKLENNILKGLRDISSSQAVRKALTVKITNIQTELKTKIDTNGIIMNA